MLNDTLSTAQNERKHFVEKEFAPVLISANHDIMYVDYIVPNIAYDDEYVRITMTNGYMYQIDITADSKIAIMLDVCRYMSSK